MKWLVTDKGTYINPLFIESMRVSKENVSVPVVENGKWVGEKTDLVFKVIAKTFAGSVFTVKAFSDPLQAQKYLEKLAEELSTIGELLQALNSTLEGLVEVETDEGYRKPAWRPL